MRVLKKAIFVYFSVTIIFLFGFTVNTNAQGLSDWTLVSGGGFGNPNNFFILSMVEFNGEIVVGTSNLFDGFEVWSSTNGGAPWVPLAVGGLGNAFDWTAWTMAVYNDQLYVGTARGRVYRYDGTPGVWTQVNVDGFGVSGLNRVRSMAVMGNALYVGTRNIGGGFLMGGGSVWRYDGTPGVWTRVGGLNQGINYNREIRSLIVYNGALYAGTGSLIILPCEVWRYNGISGDWTRVASDGFDPVNLNFGNVMVRSFTVFNGRLYAGTRDIFGDGAYVFRYEGSPDNWTQVNITGFNGDPVNDSAIDMKVYADRLFAISSSWLVPISIARVFEYNGGTQWFKVSPDNFGNVLNNHSACLLPYRDRLYAGVSNGPAGCQIWRSAYTYRIVCSAANGHGHGDPPHRIINYRSNHSINLIPDPGYRIGGIYDNGQSVRVSNPYELIRVTADHDIVVDFINDPPEISFVNPIDGMMLCGVVALQGEATDDSGVASVELYIDGLLKQTDTFVPGDTPQCTFDYSWNTAGLDPGIHTIKGIAIDEAGAKGEAVVTVNLQRIDITLNVSREKDRGWIVKKDFARVNISVNTLCSTPVAGYAIYRKGQGGEFQMIASIPGAVPDGQTVTIYNDVSIENNKSYSYMVYAVDSTGKSLAFSEESSI